MFEILELVKITHDIKEYNLSKGAQGTIVEIYKDGEAYEVEFVAPDGTSKALLTLKSEDIKPCIKETEIFDVDLVVYTSNASRPSLLIESKNVLDNLDLIVNIGEFNTKLEIESVTENKETSYLTA